MQVHIANDSTILHWISVLYMGISLYIGISVTEIPIYSRETITIFYGIVPKQSVGRSKDRKLFTVINVAFRLFLRFIYKFAFNKTLYDRFWCKILSYYRLWYGAIEFDKVNTKKSDKFALPTVLFSYINSKNVPESKSVSIIQDCKLCSVFLQNLY